MEDERWQELHLLHRVRHSEAQRRQSISQMIRFLFFFFPPSFSLNEALRPPSVRPETNQKKLFAAAFA